MSIQNQYQRAYQIYLIGRWLNDVDNENMEYHDIQQQMDDQIAAIDLTSESDDETNDSQEEKSDVIDLISESDKETNDSKEEESEVIDLTSEIDNEMPIYDDSNNINNASAYNHSAPIIDANVVMQILQILRLENGNNQDMNSDEIRQWINYDEINYDSRVDMAIYDAVSANDIAHVDVLENPTTNDAGSEASGATTISVNEYLNNIEQPQNNGEMEEIGLENQMVENEPSENALMIIDDGASETSGATTISFDYNDYMYNRAQRRIHQLEEIRRRRRELRNQFNNYQRPLRRARLAELYSDIEEDGDDDNESVWEVTPANFNRQDDGNGAICPVCIDTVVNKTPTKLPCGHITCFNCIKEYYKYKTECPQCRASIYFKKDCVRCFL